MSRAAEIDDIAARWILREESGELSVAERGELTLWLDAAPEHKAAYWRLEHTWREADRIKALGLPSMAPRTGISVWLYGSQQRVLAGLGMVAVMVLVAGGLAISDGRGPIHVTRQYATAIGKHSEVALVDGSMIDMNTQTQMRTAVTPQSRDVWLDHGEAFFQVAHDPLHPFVVHAGKAKITVLGTKFSVLRRDGNIKVAVLEGHVRVSGISPAANHAPVDLVRGNVVVADASSMLVNKLPVEKVSDDLSWREGRLVFDQTSLSDAVADFNLYNNRKLIISDPEVAAIRISGSFEATNIDSFIFLVKEGLGLHVAQNEENVTISR